VGRGLSLVVVALAALAFAAAGQARGQTTLARAASFGFARGLEMRGLAQRHIAHNLECEPFKSCDFGGMVRQQLYTTESQVMKYLRAHSVVAIYSVTGFETRFAFTDVFFLHYGISAQLIHEIKTVFALAQVQDHSLRGSGDFLQCRMQLKASVVN